MRNITKYIYLSFLLPALLSCEKEQTAVGDAAPASLELSVSVPEVSVTTKSLNFGEGGGGIVSDPDNPSSWTAWERAVDGQGMYRLTLFLIERSTTNLVGYRDIYYYGDCDGDSTVSPDTEMGDISTSDGNHNGWWDGSAVVPEATHGTMAKVSFEYDDPLHKPTSGVSFEALRRGQYRIVAVANWSAEKGSTAEPTYGMTLTGHPDGVQKFSGLGSNLGTGSTFKDIVESIKSEFLAAMESGTAKKFTDYAKYSAFSEFVLNSSTSSYLCYPMPMPLVAVEDIEVEPGFNHKSLQMQRCYSRVRITVVNNSACDLTVHNLTFCDKFTKTQTYLFDNPADPDRCFNLTGALSGASEGAPDATDAYALRSFTAETVVPALGAPGGNSVLLFDSYILENRDLSNPLTYTLDLEYVGQTGREYVVTEYSLTSTAAITSTSGLSDGGLYVMKNQNGERRFLQWGNEKVETYTGLKSGNNVTVDDLNALGSLPDNIVWKLESQGTTNSYYIRTASITPYYMADPEYISRVLLVPQPNNYFQFTDATGSYAGHIAMKSGSSANYINVNGGNQDQVIGYNYIDFGSCFDFYPVSETKTKYTTPVVYNSPITLTCIDPISAAVSPVNTINRNDFINIVVTVSFNKDAGELEFEVRPWTEKPSDITFN
ncbi:MAG: hypothetical protein ACI395_00595 [Candidatus Cryptobacteroides sp.]